MSRRGFTIVEVLATMALMAVVLPVVMRGLSIAQQTASATKHMHQAASLAQSKLNQLATEAQYSTGTSAAGGNQTGDFAPEFPEFHWNSVTTQRDYGLTELDLSVTWLERTQERSIVVSTLYLPAGTTSTSTSSTSGTGTTGTGTTGGGQ